MIIHSFITDAYVDYPYADVTVYMDRDTGDSWKIVVTKCLEEGSLEHCLEDGSLEHGDPLYAEHLQDCYDETDKPVPQEVFDFIAYNMAEILVKIGRAQAEYELKEEA